MPVRTKLLTSGQLAAAAADIYTCPVGETTIVKSVRTYNAGAGNQTLTFALRRAAAPTADLFVLQIAMGANSVGKEDPMWMVMLPGDVLRLYRSAAQTASYVVSGTQLEGLAD